MTQHGLTNRRVCLWIKNGFSPVPGVAFNKGYEACVYATRGTPYLSDIHNLTEILNKDIASGNRAIDDIIDIFDIWLAKRDSGQDYQHPTQKPITLHEKPLAAAGAKSVIAKITARLNAAKILKRRFIAVFPLCQK